MSWVDFLTPIKLITGDCMSCGGWGARHSKKSLVQLSPSGVCARDSTIMVTICKARICSSCDSVLIALGGKERKLWALRPQKPLRLIRDGEVGGSGIIYLTPTRYTVTTRMILH